MDVATKLVQAAELVIFEGPQAQLVDFAGRGVRQFIDKFNRIRYGHLGSLSLRNSSTSSCSEISSVTRRLARVVPSLWMIATNDRGFRNIFMIYSRILNFNPLSIRLRT